MVKTYGPKIGPLNKKKLPYGEFVGLIYEIADLTVLFWVISQKCSEITDF